MTEENQKIEVVILNADNILELSRQSTNLSFDDLRGLLEDAMRRFDVVYLRLHPVADDPERRRIGDHKVISMDLLDGHWEIEHFIMTDPLAWRKSSLV